LSPKNKLYRNNIATVLVEQGRDQEALSHLLAVHEEAAAHYNLGYLFNKKGQQQMAMHEFATALQIDPSMESAQRWLDYLAKTTAQARLAQNPISAGVRVIPQSPMPQAEMVKPFSQSPMPKRLPPTTLQQPMVDGPALPGISYNGSASPAAPLPPTNADGALPSKPRWQ
jgi:tetratricopeptide (TPR) repeat protein